MKLIRNLRGIRVSTALLSALRHKSQMSWAKMTVFLIMASGMGIFSTGSVAQPIPELPRVEITGQIQSGSSSISLLGPLLQNGGSGSNPAARAAFTKAANERLLPPPSVDNSKVECDALTKMPVVLTTGEKYKVEPDFTSFSAGGLSLARTYRSKQNIGFMFGPNWLSNYDWPRLARSSAQVCDGDSGCVPLYATVTDPDGSRFTYSSASSTGGRVNNYLSSGAQSTGSLTYIYSTRGWTLSKDKKNYNFDSSGQLQSISTLGGATLLTFTRTSGLVTKVTNTVGQSMAFAWTNYLVTQVTDPSSGVWNYAYNVNGMLVTVTSPGAPADVRTYHYEDPSDGKLLTGISVNGIRYSTYRYYSDKRVRESGLAGGEEVDSISYGSNSATVTDARGQPTTLQFQSVLGQLKPTNVSRAGTSTCAAASAITVFDAAGYPTYKLDWAGNRTNFSYDAGGRLTQAVTGVGTAAQLGKTTAWSGVDVIEENIVDAAGVAFLRTSNTYYSYSSGFASGLLSGSIMSDLRTGAQRQIVYSYTFSSVGALTVLTVTQQLPNALAVTTYNYDSAGNLTSIMNPIGQTISYSNYNGLGRAGRITDPNGVPTDYIWDAKGNLQSTTEYVAGGSRVTNFAYNNARQVTDISYADGRVSRMRYSASLRQISAGNALNEFVQFNVNVPTNTASTIADRRTPSLNGQTPVANAAGQFASITRLDSLGRAMQALGNNGQQVTTTYDANGNVKTHTDAAGRSTNYSYDAQDRVVSVTAPDGGITTFSYDAEGRLQSVKDPRNLLTSYTYNGLGDVLTQTSPDTGTTTYTYDSAGRMATKALADGVTISYTWDKLGRATSRSSAGVTETFTYDEGTYGKGRLTRMNDATGQTSYTYSAAGELVQQVNVIYGNIYTTGWTHDVAGRLTGMSYPTGLSLSYGYDAYGRLSAVYSNLGGTWATLVNPIATAT